MLSMITITTIKDSSYQKIQAFSHGYDFMVTYQSLKPKPQSFNPKPETPKLQPYRPSAPSL